jgi:hypothetical protein
MLTGFERPDDHRSILLLHASIGGCATHRYHMQKDLFSRVSPDDSAVIYLCPGQEAQGGKPCHKTAQTLRRTRARSCEQTRPGKVRLSAVRSHPTSPNCLEPIEPDRMNLLFTMTNNQAAGVTTSGLNFFPLGRGKGPQARWRSPMEFMFPSKAMPPTSAANRGCFAEPWIFRSAVRRNRAAKDRGWAEGPEPQKTAVGLKEHRIFRSAAP